MDGLMASPCRCILALVIYYKCFTAKKKSEPLFIVIDKKNISLSSRLSVRKIELSP